MLNAAAIILAGGKNTRMGTTKALLEIEDRQLIRRVMDELNEFTEIIIVANDSERYRSLGVRVTADIIPDRGPLSGIHAGLTVSPHRLNFVTACDMPFVSGPLAAHMITRIGDADALVPRIDDKWQPLFAVYSRNCLKAITDCLEQERCKVTAFYPAVRVKYIEEDEVRRFTDPEKVFYNVNTPAELARARIMAGAGEGAGKQPPEKPPAEEGDRLGPAD